MTCPNRSLDFGDFQITSVSGRVETVDTGSSPLGQLASLVGTWEGPGFNQIWRPRQTDTDGLYETFLELNHTHEELQFVEIPGGIANRAFLRDPINLYALSYLQKINDVHQKDDRGKPAGIHFETGMWINVMKHDENEHKVVRLANIPHGTSIVAEGTASPIELRGDGSFDFERQDIRPIDVVGNDISTSASVPEMNLDDDSEAVKNHRTPLPTTPPLITPEMLKDPNSILKKANEGIKFSRVTKLHISTYDDRVPKLTLDKSEFGYYGDAADPNFLCYRGGPGASNITFLRSYENYPHHGIEDPNIIGPNAQVVRVDADFYIEEFSKNDEPHYQLQYSQNVTLYFSGVRWPHVSVATLRRK